MLRLYTVAASLNSSWKTHGLGMPYDAERVGQLRKMLVEARKRIFLVFDVELCRDASRSTAIETAPTKRAA
jgi:hypothetical protein